MSASSPLMQSAARLKDWTIQRALPHWAQRGLREDGSWVEHLRLDGTPDIAAERRWRVLARQVYVYAEAARHGWYPNGEAVAVKTYDRLQEIGYVHRVSAGGAVTNPMRDLYDHAFYLLSAASLYRLTQKAKYLADAEAILNTLDRDFAHDISGWKETSSGGSPRRQNPHMHLLEASLYLYGGTKNPKHLKYARSVFGLFKAHFYDTKTRTIREFFQDDWQLASGDLGDIAEPGHAMEWVWLLSQFSAATGVDTAQYRNALYLRAQLERDWFLNDEEDVSGNIRRETKRLWVQTEVIKAHLAQAEQDVPGAADMAASVINALFGPYLKADGTWHDQINACGANVATTIPVSTFYHIMCMAREAERVGTLLA